MALIILQWYGWVEGLVGIVKLFFVVAGALFLLIIGAHSKQYWFSPVRGLNANRCQMGPNVRKC